MTHSPTRRQLIELIILAMILALAAILRFGWPGVSSFGYDEARVSLIALDWARNGNFPSLGMTSSAGVPNMPAAAWLFTLPYLISNNPQLATWFAGLLNALAVFGVWALIRSVWGRIPALAAAIVLAAAPYSVLYARSIWAQNLLAPFGLLWAATAFWGLTTNRKWLFAIHAFVAGFAVQIHFAGAALALGTVVILIRWRPPIIPVLIGAAAAGLCGLPFAINLLQSPDTLTRFTSTGSQAGIDFQSLEAFAQLAGQQSWNFLAAGQWTGLGRTPEFVSLIGIILLCLGMIVAIRTLVQRGTSTQRTFAELILIWLLCTPIFFLRHSTPVYIHYMLASLPALAILTGLSTRLVPKTGWAWCISGLCGMVALGWSIQIGAQLNAVQQSNWEQGIGTVLQNVQRTASSVPEDKPVLFFTHGDDPSLNGEAAAFSVLWWGREYRILGGNSLLILPDTPATLLATLAPFPAWEELVAAELVSDIHEYPRRGSELPFIATDYNGHTPPQGYTSTALISLEDGSTLRGWRVRQVGPRLRISTVWDVNELPPDGEIHQFHHLYTQPSANDQPFMVSDVPVSSHSWRPGDTLIVMADFFDVPQGNYTLNIGRYTLPELVRLPRTDGEGDAIRLPEFTWQPGG